MERQDARMELYNIHDNVLDYFSEFCIPVLDILGLEEHLKYAYSILRAVRKGDYDGAWSGIIAFMDMPGIPAMFKRYDSIERAITVLAKTADEFDL